MAIKTSFTTENTKNTKENLKLRVLGNCSLRCSTSCVRAVVGNRSLRRLKRLLLVLYLLRPCSRPPSVGSYLLHDPQGCGDRDCSLQSCGIPSIPGDQCSRSCLRGEFFNFLKTNIFTASYPTSAILSIHPGESCNTLCGIREKISVQHQLFRTKLIGTTTELDTGVSPCLAGIKFHLSTASIAASSSTSWPLLCCTVTSSLSPSADTFTSKRTVPSQPRLVAIPGYFGLGLVP